MPNSSQTAAGSDVNGNVRPGTVYLVGAGPGDPALITLRGVECLRAADVVLYDYLVNPRLLEHVRPCAEKVCLGRHGKGRLLSQQEINAQIVASAFDGKHVVRLKAGDSIVFARAAEEIEALAAAGVPFEIVPGITAALAAGSYAGIPLTMRDRSSAVALVTGHESPDKQTPELDFAGLAQFPGTLVVYMGVTSAPRWVSALINAGKRGDTPAAIVRRCSWADQRVLRTTLERVPIEIEARKIRPPAIVVVGDVSGWETASRWFTDRPLFGQRVLLTRPVEQLGASGRRFEAVGAEVLVQPAIEIRPVDDTELLDGAIGRAATFDWIVFSSVNGVRHFFERLEALGRDARALSTAKMAVIGPGTREALRAFHLHADLEPTEHRAEALAAALAPDAAGKRFLLIRASRGREVLAETLRGAGGNIEQVVAYESRDVQAADPETVEQFEQGRIDWVTVTSSAIARSLVNLFGDRLRQTRLASISPITSATIRELGFEPAVEARNYTLDGLLAAILEARRARSSRR